MKKFTKMIWAMAIMLISCGKNIESPKIPELPPSVLEFTLNGKKIICNDKIMGGEKTPKEGVPWLSIKGTDTIQNVSFSLYMKPCPHEPITYALAIDKDYCASIKTNMGSYLAGYFGEINFQYLYWGRGTVSFIQIPTHNQTGILTWEGTFAFSDTREYNNFMLTDGYFKCYQFK
jgi:hypothetical protein